MRRWHFEPLARHAASLLGIDVERAAVTDATRTVTLPNARFRTGAADHALRELIAGQERFDLPLLHAMRLPFGPEVLPRLPLLGITRALDLAPSAAALARDLATSPRLRPTHLVILDQLPGTMHLLTFTDLEDTTA